MHRTRNRSCEQTEISLLKFWFKMIFYKTNKINIHMMKKCNHLHNISSSLIISNLSHFQKRLK